MQLFTIGVNHQTAPLALREQVVFHADIVTQALRDLVDRWPVKEAAIISTCNRTEVYCATAEPHAAVDWLAGYHHLRPQQIEPYLYQLPREQAVKHAFRVASGLDSMVLGEPQILGQFKDAVRTAQAAGTLGWLLNKLFQRTFSVAKTVRSETDIGASTVSMASAAVQLAEHIYPSIADQNVLFIGAGEMVELTAAHFAAHHPRRMTFANRTPERAQQLAERFLGRTITLNDLSTQLAVHDIVVACTASPLPIIGKGLIESALRARKHRPMLMFDLAVPRDVEGEVGKLDDVFLYTVDDLGKIARDGMDVRQNAVTQAEVIIENQVTDFMHWLDNRELVPTIRALRDTAERSRRHELERALRRLGRGDDPQRVIEQLSRALTNKFLHAPTHALNHVEAEEREEFAALLTRLYQIKSPE
ncbi:MAG: glutamyl-tRNA reductase [Betaproteobacteria bacterium RIFCSPLOWO2_12_FULL_62_58]|nr:MAG: glutamyl-tRNA reductase [Betaproteobacteria bacterium RIFCSPLOWO2_02_FULL_62_79]OGA49143.1 MAG: glutamyl-tRNA reductase [Betaproteobacteria bacterium RIFCSPLOWO2_12_FULL_62_58]